MLRKVKSVSPVFDPLKSLVINIIMFLFCTNKQIMSISQKCLLITWGVWGRGTKTIAWASSRLQCYSLEQLAVAGGPGQWLTILWTNCFKINTLSLQEGTRNKCYYSSHFRVGWSWRPVSLSVAALPAVLGGGGRGRELEGVNIPSAQNNG